MINILLNEKKKIPSDIPKWSFSRFWDNVKPLSGNGNFFSQNLTYLHSFLGWNLPGITMSLESLHNYFGITVKSRKNNEKFGFFDFCLWSRNNVGIIVTLRLFPVNFTPKNNMINFFFHKKKFRSDIANWSFTDFDIEPETPFGNRKFFFLTIYLTRIFFWGEIYRELPCRWNH